MTRAPLLALLLAAGLALPLAAHAAPAPDVGIKDFAELKTPLPYPYDDKADAKTTDQRVAAGLAKAKREHKLLAIDLGGNWCPDCRILAGTLESPKLEPFIKAHYVVVPVDTGRFDKNLQIPARYGITERMKGVPSVLVVDPKTDKLLNEGHTTALSDARHMSPQALADWFAQYTN